MLFACSRDNAVSVRLAINPSQVEVGVGEIQVLNLLVNDSEVSANLADWTSSDVSTAIVVDGIVQGVSAGLVIITAEYQGCRAECFVSVMGEAAETAEDLSASIRYLKKSIKRGVGYRWSQFPAEDIAALAPFISWSYNWGSQPTSDEISDMLDNHDLEYIPMAWNGVNASQIRAYKLSHPACAYILAFNEPNLTDQANMTPQQAAAQWPELKALADELGLKIVAPAMNYGTLAGYSDPIVWLDEFFELIPISDVCALALHCYMGSAGAMYSYIRRFDKYDLPLWMTEFCSWDQPAPSSVLAQIDYMNEAIVMLEADPNVERYAWFIPRADGAVDSYPYMQLLSKTDIGSLSPQGEVFAAIPSLDKSEWLPTSAPILPNTYADCSAAESIRNGSFVAAPHLEPTTDNAGTLMMTNLVGGNWIDYQLNVLQATDTLLLRHVGLTKSNCTVSVDGVHATDVELPWTNNDWVTAAIPLQLTAGHHTLRLQVNGNISFNWFKVK